MRNVERKQMATNKQTGNKAAIAPLRSEGYRYIKKYLAKTGFSSSEIQNLILISKGMSIQALSSYIDKYTRKKLALN